MVFSCSFLRVTHPLFDPIELLFYIFFSQRRLGQRAVATHALGGLEKKVKTKTTIYVVSVAARLRGCVSVCIFMAVAILAPSSILFSCLSEIEAFGIWQAVCVAFGGRGLGG